LSRPDTFPRAEPLSPGLSAALNRSRERLGRFGRQVCWYPEVPSTNDLAASLAEHGAPEGATVVADAQTAGRGRHGRAWCSPPGAGLYVSVVLRPHARSLPLVTIAAGVAVVEGIRAATGLGTALKWPNDVMVPGRANGGAAKLAGILAESASSHVVLGFGINVRPAAYPPDVAARAVSLEGELGRPIDRDALLVECLAGLATRYDDLQCGRQAAVLDAWRSYARPLLGARVEWDRADGLGRGIAEDVDPSGALLVRTQSGMVRVISGEVRWT